MLWALACTRRCDDFFLHHWVTASAGRHARSRRRPRRCRGRRSGLAPARGCAGGQVHPRVAHGQAHVIEVQDLDALARQKADRQAPLPGAPLRAREGDVLGPIPSDLPSLVQLGRSASGKRVVSVIGIVVAVPAYPQ